MPDYIEYTLNARLNSFSYKLASIWNVKTDWFENFNLLIKLWHKVDKFMPSPPTFMHSITHSIPFFFLLHFRCHGLPKHRFAMDQYTQNDGKNDSDCEKETKRVGKIEWVDDEQKSNNEIQFWPLPQRFCQAEQSIFCQQLDIYVDCNLLFCTRMRKCVPC